jgi:hypothetical protein
MPDLFPEDCWADPLNRAERRALREMLARNSQMFWEASAPGLRRIYTRDLDEREALRSALLEASMEMADLHLDVTERAAVPPRGPASPLMPGLARVAGLMDSAGKANR